jgi:hypothetical protein
MFASSDAEAARESGIAVSTVYGWPNLADVRECVKLSKMDGITVAQEKLRRLASRAVDVIADEMTAKRGSSKRLEAAMTALDGSAWMSSRPFASRSGIGAVLGGGLDRSVTGCGTGGQRWR